MTISVNFRSGKSLSFAAAVDTFRGGGNSPPSFAIRNSFSPSAYAGGRSRFMAMMQSFSDLMMQPFKETLTCIRSAPQWEFQVVTASIGASIFWWIANRLFNAMLTEIRLFKRRWWQAITRLKRFQFEPWKNYASAFTLGEFVPNSLFSNT